MSAQTQPYNPDDGLLARIADQITPLFQTSTTDPAFARATALGALAAYYPESAADYVNIARILAFSMAALAALGIAATDLPPAQKMRYFGRANALNRSADQTERMMTQRRRNHRANPPAEPDPHLIIPLADDPVIDAGIEEAMAAYRAAMSHPAGQPAQTAAPETRPQPRPSSAETTLRAAMQTPGPKSHNKQTLLPHSAMTRIIGPGPTQPQVPTQPQA
jgi:hypothetical protein